ncbi:hypothetical protein J4427_01810 [Candidatus Woesearchaeota archaeon]|nr:hypothetical protein [Candidatus Woesearchaeota archaeon]
MKSKTLVKIAFFCLLAGIGLIAFREEDITGFSALEENIVHESYKSIDLYFCERDNCESIESKLINGSSRVDCAFYDIDLEKIKNSLAKKQYRLVTDDTSDVEIAHKEDTKKQLMHDKFCVLDNKIFTGSFNPKKSSLFKDYNNLLVIESDYLVKNYADEFSELWDGNFGSGTQVIYPIIDYGGTRIENYFCPEDSCRDHLLSVLDGANSSINFLVFSFTDDQIAQKLVDKHNFGIRVSGVLEKQRRNMQYEKYNFLKENGVDVRLDSNPYLLHDKTFIIDNNILVLGSYNPTSAGNNKNDENILIIYNKELANKMNSRFSGIYNQSQGI